MSRFDALLDRVTERLALDPELRLEVRHELAGHLEDCAREFETAGVTEEDAAKKAAESFGDEREVSERLYAANRHRMKVRSAMRWAGRLTLAPAAVAVLIPITTGAVASVLMLAAMMGGLRIGNIPSTTMIGGTILRHLTPDQRLLFEGPAGEMTHGQRAKAILDRNPNDVVLYANYATASLMDPGATRVGTKENPSTVIPADVQRLISIMDRGEAIEPDNAYYPLLKSTILFDASTRPIDEPDEQRPGFAWVAPEASSGRWTFNRLEILDRPMFDRAVAAFHAAAGKPTLNDHTTDFLALRLSVLPPAGTLGEQLFRMSAEWSMLLPDLNYMRMGTQYAANVAIGEAEAGHRERALEVLRDSKAVARLEARGPYSFLIGLLVSWGTHKNALAGEVVVANLLKMPELETAAREKLRGDEEFYKHARGDTRGWRYGQEAHLGRGDAETRTHLQQMGFIENVTTPAHTDWEKTDLSPGRNAEYAVVDQLAVALMAAGLFGIAAMRIGRTLFHRWRRREWPTFVFVGWRQVIKILGLAVVLPVGVYIAYLAPFGVRRFGLPLSLERAAVEYSLLGAVILVTLRLLTYSAIQQRCMELGLATTPKYRPGKITLAIGALVVLAAIGYGVYWRYSVDGETGDRFDGWGALIALAIAIYAVLALRPGQKRVSRQPKKAPIEVPRDTWNRPLPPVAVASAIGAMAMLVVLAFAMGGHRNVGEVLLILFPYFLGIVGIIAALGFGLVRYVPSLFKLPVWPEPLLGMRASVPVLLLAALLLSAGAGSVARWNEHRNAAHFQASSLNLSTELERSHLRVLRDRMQSDDL